MKKRLLSGIVMLSLGLGLLTPVLAAESIAVVDVRKVVSNSKQVQALKSEQDKKNQELRKWLNTVRADIAKQSTDESKQKLAKKYDGELAKKKEVIQKDYAKKLAEIELARQCFRKLWEKNARMALILLLRHKLEMTTAQIRIILGEEITETNIDQIAHRATEEMKVLRAKEAL